MNQFRYKLKFACFQLPLVVADAIDNRRHCTANRRILITRHAAKRTQMLRHFLAWVARSAGIAIADGISSAAVLCG